MRPLHELINTEEPAWVDVQEWIAGAKNPVEVLPANNVDREAALLAIQVTTRSPMGAVVYETGGLLIDHGWLRILGSGHERLPRSLPGWNQGRTMFGDAEPPGYLLVADDVLGGFFAINGGGSLGPDPGSMYYFAPEAMEWQPMDLNYSQFLIWSLQGDVAGFYEHVRWPGWEDETRTVAGDRAIFIMPFLSTAGPPIKQRHHGNVPISEMFDLHLGKAG